MKKGFIALFLVAASVSLAQTNFQVHYDFGSGREYVTTTFETFNPDDWGNTFIFVDFNFDYGNENHPALSYMEIARCLNFWGGPFSAQVEYNGGSYNFAGNFTPIENCLLAGIDYSLHNADFTKTLNIKALFKQIMGEQSSAQITGVWGLKFMNKKISFLGFADLWWEKNTYITDGVTHPVFISEPQLWYNVTEHFSVGSEVEIAANFAGTKGLKACPTLGLKWTF